MKFTKQMLAAVLVFALALTLALSAFAEDEETGEPASAIPVITVQPQRTHVKQGESFTLSAGVHVPNGDNVRWTWYGPNGSITHGEGGNPSVTINNVGRNHSGEYYFMVHNENDQYKSYPGYAHENPVYSEKVRVDVQLTFFSAVFGTIWDGIKYLGALLLELPFALLFLLMPIIAVLAAPFLLIANLFR